MDLGAGTFRTFYKITLPMLRSSLLAGGLLAFALSFDEIIVTTFTVGQGIQTLPIWIYQNLFRPNQAPVVNVVAAALIVVSRRPDLDRPEARRYRRERRRRPVANRRLRCELASLETPNPRRSFRGSSLALLAPQPPNKASTRSAAPKVVSPWPPPGRTCRRRGGRRPRAGRRCRWAPSGRPRRRQVDGELSRRGRRPSPFPREAVADVAVGAGQGAPEVGEEGRPALGMAVEVVLAGRGCPAIAAASARRPSREVEPNSVASAVSEPRPRAQPVRGPAATTSRVTRSRRHRRLCEAVRPSAGPAPDGEPLESQLVGEQRDLLGDEVSPGGVLVDEPYPGLVMARSWSPHDARRRRRSLRLERWPASRGAAPPGTPRGRRTRTAPAPAQARTATSAPPRPPPRHHGGRARRRRSSGRRGRTRWRSRHRSQRRRCREHPPRRTCARTASARRRRRR